MSVSVPALTVSVASAEDAAGIVEVIHAAFGARPTLDPPSTAINETADSVRRLINSGGGLFATVGDRPAGVILIARDGDIASLQRVSVHPDFQRHGVASTLVHVAEEYAAELGCRRVELFARVELPELIDFWRHRGFTVDREQPHGVILAKDLPVRITVPDTEAMHDLGERLADLLESGDLIIASGDLGAGKTTLTQGIGRGLGSDGPIISPTFVIARIHPSKTGRPALVHADAYRLSGLDELEDLDLDTSIGDSVTVVEWGAGMAENLADHRLEIDIRRSLDEHDETRTVFVRTVGERWSDVDLRGLGDEDRSVKEGHV